MFLIRPPLAQQPQFAAQIDRSNPLTRGLVFAVDAGIGAQREIITDLAPTVFNGSPSTAGPYRSVYVNAAAADNWQWGDNANATSSPLNGILSGATQSTVELVFRTRSTATTPHAFGQWNLSSGNHWLVQINGTGLVWVAAEDDAANRRRWDGSGLFTANRVHRLILSWRGGSDYTAILDGSRRVLTAVNTAATSIRTNVFALRIASNTGGTPDLDIGVARVWNRGLSEAECFALASRHPAALYQPMARRVWGSLSGPPPSVVNGQTLTATATVSVVGAASTDAVVAGQVITATATVAVAGVATTDTVVSGQTLTATATMSVVGAALVDAVVAGRLLVATALAIPGSAFDASGSAGARRTRMHLGVGLGL